MQIKPNEQTSASGWLLFATVSALLGLASGFIYPAQAEDIPKPLSGEVTKNAHRKEHKKLEAGASKVITKKLDNGGLLLSPPEDEVVETPFGVVDVQAHCVTLIVVTDNFLAVYDLHDTHKNSILIHHDKMETDLMPWCMAVVARTSVADFEHANPAPFVAYRRIKTSEVGEDHKLFEAEYNANSLVRGLPALKKMMIKAESKAAQKDMDSMLKTFVIMSPLTASNEPFGYYLTPELKKIVEAEAAKQAK